MNSKEEWRRLRIFVLLLLAVQLVSVILAWLLNPVGQRSQTDFALLLAANLVAFSIVSYINRVEGRGDGLRGSLVVGGSAVVLLFMFLVLVA